MFRKFYQQLSILLIITSSTVLTTQDNLKQNSESENPKPEPPTLNATEFEKNLKQKYIAAIMVHGPAMPTYNHYRLDGMDDKFDLPHDSLTHIGQEMAFRLGKAMSDNLPSDLKGKYVYQQKFDLYSIKTRASFQNVHSFMLGFTSDQDTALPENTDSEIWIPHFLAEKNSSNSANNRNSSNSSLSSEDKNTTGDNTDLKDGRNIENPENLFIKNFINNVDHNTKFFGVQSTSKQNDLLFLPSLQESCPKISKILDQMLPKYQSEIQILAKDFIDDLNSRGISSRRVFGNSDWKTPQFSQLYTSMQSLKAHGLKFPLNLTDSDYDRVQKIHGLNLLSLTADPLYKKVFTSAISGKILDSLTAQVEGYNDQEYLSLFSGEDQTLLSFLVGLGLSNYQCNKMELQEKRDKKECVDVPEYGANIVFELFQEQSSGEHYIATKYNGNRVKICDELIDDWYCSWRDFNEYLVSGFMEPDLRESCGLSARVIYELKVNETVYYRYTIAKQVMIFINFLMLMLLIICWVATSRRFQDGGLSLIPTLFNQRSQTDSNRHPYLDEEDSRVEQKEYKRRAKEFNRYRSSDSGEDEEEKTQGARFDQESQVKSKIQKMRLKKEKMEDFDGMEDMREGGSPDLDETQEFDDDFGRVHVSNTKKNERKLKDI